jgi:hypothetical protein
MGVLSSCKHISAHWKDCSHTLDLSIDQSLFSPGMPHQPGLQSQVIVLCLCGQSIRRLTHGPQSLADELDTLRLFTRRVRRVLKKTNQRMMESRNLACHLRILGSCRPKFGSESPWQATIALCSPPNACMFRGIGRICEQTKGLSTLSPMKRVI